MTTCDDVLAARTLGTPLGAAEEEHARDCARCRALEPTARALAAALAGYEAAEPPADLSARVLRAAAPVLGARARRTSWGVVARAVGAALLPLPFVVAFDAWIARAAHALLRTVLPEALSAYLVFNYVALAALLLAASYAAIPLVAERQARFLQGASHG